MSRNVLDENATSLKLHLPKQKKNYLGSCIMLARKLTICLVAVDAGSQNEDKVVDEVDGCVDLYWDANTLGHCASGASGVSSEQPQTH